jgi:putative ABC transport system permease protein
MRKVTIKGLLAHKWRLALTSLAIVLGVTFVAGTFVLTDTLHNTVYALIGNAYQKLDFEVRGVAQFPTSNAPEAVRNPFPETLLSTVRNVPGVQTAEGVVGGYAQFLAPDGKPIVTGSEPTVGESFDPDQQASELRVVEGAPPSGPDEVVMDAGTAKKYHFSVGQRVRVLFADGAVRPFRISGIAQFGNADNLAGETLAVFSLTRAQQVLDEEGQLNDIGVVAKPGADKSAVQAAISKALPNDVEVVTGQTLRNEETSSVNKSLGFLSTALLVFAFISLFVGAFTIFNTFSITVGQRTRELALLRVVGASRRQVFASVLAEAAVVGAISSLIGIALGALAAIGLEGLMNGLGYALPSGPLVFEARTASVGFAVGIGVTVISAVGPARRAVRIAPVAAISHVESAGDVPAPRRLASGAAVGSLGVLMLVPGLAAGALAPVGAGAAFVFVAVAMLAPAVAKPLSSAIGRPLAALLGVAGRLGRENSMRNPKRTAQTASALMVGIALVSALAVFGASVSSTTAPSVDNAIKANLIVTGSNNGPGFFGRALADKLVSLPGVSASLIVFSGEFEVQQSLETLVGVSTTGLGKTVSLQMNVGSTSALRAGELLIDSSTAASDHLSVGRSVPVKFALTGPSTLRVGGIFKANPLVGSYVVSQAFYISHFRRPLPSGVLLSAEKTAKVQREVEGVLSAYPTVHVQTRAQYEKSLLSSVNQLLTLVYALLALAVLVALIGVVNTLMLSVFERSREIGLLRAVGMQRRQVRAMVRSESVILSVFGAVLGVVVGTGMGIALGSALELTNTVPISRIVEFLALSALLGLVAATWPARWAAKLDILAAIADE